MDSILGMTPTGRRISGPAADLVEVESAKGLKHTAICYHDEFIEHPALIADVKEFGGFMEKPGVSGLVEMVDADEDEGMYLYPTGSTWSVAEVVRAYNDLGDKCGTRAGLELAYVTAQILQEAEEAAAKHELFNHGSLDPWKIMLKANGQVVVIGYGLPQVDMLDFLEDESMLPKEDGFRYAPPERIEDEGEDLSTDLFSLSLIALEVMVGRPVYDGLINDIRQQATRAEGAYRLHQWRSLLPDSVREALGRAIKYDADARYPDATEYAYVMHDLLGSLDAEGLSLHEVMKRVKHSTDKGKPLIGGRTAALTREELARMAADLDDDDDDEAQPLAPPSRPRAGDEDSPEEGQKRWGKATRPRRDVGDRPRRRGDGGSRSRSSSERASRSRDEPRRASRDMRDSRGNRPRDSVRDRPRRVRQPEPEPSPPPPPPKPQPKPTQEETVAEDPRSSSAADLLARLRSSAGVKSSGGKPASKDPTATPPTRSSASPPAAVAGGSGATRSSRKSSGDRDNDEKETFQVDVGGTLRKVKLRVGDTLAECADRLISLVAEVPTDLAGHLTGWYRLEQGGEWFGGDETADVLDTGESVALAFVPNRVFAMTITVEGVDPEIRFQAPVGTAVPMQSLIAHLRRTFDLPDEEWDVYVDGTALDPLQILEDVGPRSGLQLVVKS